jgi:hypothetical protein
MSHPDSENCKLLGSYPLHKNWNNGGGVGGGGPPDNSSFSLIIIPKFKGPPTRSIIYRTLCDGKGTIQAGFSPKAVHGKKKI